MQFLLFLLANALLFIRPSEFIPGLEAVELYRYVILACLVVSIPQVLAQLSLRFPGVPPIAGCVFALFPAVLLSNLSHGNFDQLVETGIEFFKVLVYFLLLLALLTTLAQVRRLLFWLTLFTAGLALIAVQRYHTDAVSPTTQVEAVRDENGMSKLNGTFVVDRERDPVTGEMKLVQRMCGTGIFNDPNDLALAILCVVPFCFYWMGDPARKAARPFWLGVLLLLGYALSQTHSRGGFLALLAGLATLLHLRYGGKRTLLLALLGIPVLLIGFAGRMTSISTSDGTGQSRIQLWSEALDLVQQAPLFGIGMFNYGNFSRHVAHNSYLHSFAELGLFGGTLFIGAFYFALRGLYAARTPPSNAVPQDTDSDPEVSRLHPYLMAMLVSYCVGILFLSRCYIVPTFMVLGLVTVYLRLHGQQAAVPIAVGPRLILPRLAGLCVCFLVGAYTFVRLFVVW